MATSPIPGLEAPATTGAVASVPVLAVEAMQPVGEPISVALVAKEVLGPASLLGLSALAATGLRAFQVGEPTVPTALGARTRTATGEVRLPILSSVVRTTKGALLPVGQTAAPRTGPVVGPGVVPTTATPDAAVPPVPGASAPGASEAGETGTSEAGAGEASAGEVVPAALSFGVRD